MKSFGGVSCICLKNVYHIISFQYYETTDEKIDIMTSNNIGDGLFDLSLLLNRTNEVWYQIFDLYITKLELVFRDKLWYGAGRKLVYLSSDENSNLTKIQNYENFVRGRNDSPENSKIRSSRPKIMSSTPHFNPYS